jgi:signal transduction histidine kinase
MASRMRQMDWTATPLGSPDQWPQSLRSTVSMMLPSKAQIIVFWGREFTVLYNDAYRPVFGAKHPRALGLPGKEAWSEIWENQLHDLLAGVVRTGEAFWARDLLFEIERYGFREETYFDVSYDPVRDESGDVGGVFCIVTETTERVVGARRLALLRDLAARNATARTARDACAIAVETLAARPDDITFAAVYFGDALQCATPGGERMIADCPPTLMRTLPIGATTAAVRAARLIVGLNACRPFDEDYRSFVNLVADQVGTALANAHAHEEERARAESLAELDRAKTAFFSNVSHEFRTPLTLMLGPVERLLAEVNGPLSDGQRHEVAILKRGSRRLLKLVNTLLDFSRIEAGRMQATYAPTDLCALTRELTGAFRSAIEHAGLRFEVECAAIPEPVYLDRDMWEKIVLNLLSNALKYTFEGSIRVEVRPDHGAFELIVEDTGIGIPEAEQPRIFERFHRIEGARARTHEGTGIGLALTHELVRLHGGTIALDSRVERGTRFTVRVPTGFGHLPADRIVRAPEGPASRQTSSLYVDEALRWLPEPRTSETAAPALRPGRDRVLVADDNRDMREYLRQLLREWDVTTVSDGLAALEHAQSSPPQLIVTDVMMPGLDGFALLRELRADIRTKAVPVLMLSARAGEEALVSGLDAGADDYVTKPFGAQELVARVRSLVNLSRARRDAEAANQTKDQFLAMLGHELRNPLAPILTALQLMNLRGEESSLKERAVIDRQVRHLVRLIDDLLDVSRIARGKIELRHQTIDVADLVACAVEGASPLLEERHHRLSLDVPHGLLVSGDVTRLTQVVVNILSNAAKYTESSGDIALSVRHDACHVRITVKDSGVGISPDMLPRVFELFAQERQTLDRSHGGLGLGLTIAKRLVELHNGTIEARSEGLGRGSEFIIRLPPALADEHARTSQALRKKLSPTAAGRRILIVDDNLDAARLMSDALEVVGYDTRVAFDGPTALATAAEFRPHAALLDLGLPLMDGYELAERMRTARGQRRVVLVAVTGYGQVSDREKSRAAGFDAHVVKPVDVPRLISLLEQHLAGTAMVLHNRDDGGVRP